MPDLSLLKNASRLHEQQCKLFGQLIAIALLFRANEPRCFWLSVAKFVLDPDIDDSSVDDIPSSMVREKLKS